MQARLLGDVSWVRWLGCEFWLSLANCMTLSVILFPYVLNGGSTSIYLIELF